MVAYPSSRSLSLVAFLIGIPLLIAAELWIVHSTYFHSDTNLLSLGITLDIVLGIPLLYYALVVRKTALPASSVIPVGILSFFVASAVLPTPHHQWLDSIKLVFPLAELVVVGYILLKARTLVRAYRQAQHTTPYIMDAAEHAVHSVLQKTPSLPIHIALMELHILYFGIAGWWKHFDTSKVHATAMSYYRSNGYPAVLAALCMVAVIETVGVHILLAQWSVLAAWIASALSIYGVLWLLGDFHAQRLHPILITNRFIHIRSGMRWKADIPVENLLSVQRATASDAQANGYLNASATGTPSLTLHLATPVLFRGLFGIQKQASVVGIAANSIPEALAALSPLCSGKE